MSIILRHTSVESSKNAIFYNAPRAGILPHRQKTWTDYADTPKKMVALLRQQGPLLSFARTGPISYATAAQELPKPLFGRTVYFWPSGTLRTGANAVPLFLLGAKIQSGGKGFVFFSLCKKEGEEPSVYVPATDKKVYTVSLERFKEDVQVIFGTQACFTKHAQPTPPRPQTEKPSYKQPIHLYVSSTPRARPKLSKQQKGYVNQLCALDLDSILDRGAGEARCATIGRAIFKNYKKNGDSMAGKKAMQDICKAVHFCASAQGSLRKEYIARAWDGIGDATWTWRA